TPLRMAASADIARRRLLHRAPVYGAARARAAAPRRMLHSNIWDAMQAVKATRRSITSAISRRRAACCQSRDWPRPSVSLPPWSAISIGSGGPFGAEGPIIMTGGAFGSLIAQFFHLTSAERKTLLVAGAAAGMSATFAAPVASVMLAVELLLFEWKPRSLIPVALASVAAAAARRHLLGLGPIFPVPPHATDIGLEGLLGCVVVGLLAGVLSALLTAAVYASEDAFAKLPIHWMWWPAIGGLAI